MPQNSQTGAWQGTTFAPAYDNGPTADALEPYSRLGGRAAPPVHLIPPPSMLSIIASQKILPPDDGKKNSKKRLTEAVMALPPAPFIDPFLPGVG